MSSAAPPEGDSSLPPILEVISKNHIKLSRYGDFKENNFGWWTSENTFEIPLLSVVARRIVKSRLMFHDQSLCGFGEEALLVNLLEKSTGDEMGLLLSHAQEINATLDSFLALDHTALEKVEADVYRFFQHLTKGVDDDGYGSFVCEKASDVWKRTRIGRQTTHAMKPFVRRRKANGKLYISLQCQWDWSAGDDDDVMKENSLHIVLEEGKFINYVGPFVGGHLTNADVHGDWGDANLDGSVYFSPSIIPPSVPAVKKAAPKKKAPPKKVPAKKAAPKKRVPAPAPKKKAPVKKAPPKKVGAKRAAAPKKVPAKKAAPKKASKKKATPAKKKTT